MNYITQWKGIQKNGEIKKIIKNKLIYFLNSHNTKTENKKQKTNNKTKKKIHL